MIGPGCAVVASLREPRERIWGLVRALEPAGVTLEGCDVDSFDGWVRSVAGGEDPRSLTSVYFFPMGRIERLLLDRDGPGSPSLAERFRRLTGRSVSEALAPGGTE